MIFHLAVRTSVAPYFILCSSLLSTGRWYLDSIKAVNVNATHEKCTEILLE